MTILKMATVLYVLPAVFFVAGDSGDRAPCLPTAVWVEDIFMIIKLNHQPVTTRPFNNSSLVPPLMLWVVMT